MTVTLSPITLNELRPLIAYAYLGDDDLIQKYQADTSRSYEECIDFNFNEIKGHIESKEPIEVYLWKINYYGITIGYCVTLSHDSDAPDMLLSYSINKDYRTAIVLLQWLQAIEQEIGIPYYTGLWSKNTRAIGFFEKNGFVRFDVPGREDYVYLVKNPELLDRKKLFAAGGVASD